MTHYYIYYRADAARLDELRGRVDALFAEVARQTGVRGRWLRRSDDPTTFMEVYEGVRDAPAFEALLEREAKIPGVARTTERFVCA